MSLTLLCDGIAAQSFLLQSIAAARHRIYWSSYIWRDDAAGHRFFDALVQQMERVPTLHVHIYKDRFGSWYNNLFYRLNPAGRSPDLFRNVRVQKILKTHAARLHLHWCGGLFWDWPPLHIDHSKILLFDPGTVTARGVIGGMNFSDSYFLPVQQGGWHDYLVTLSAAAVDFLWKQLQMRQYRDRFQTPDLQLVQNTPAGYRIAPVVQQALQQAQRHILLEHAYLTDPTIMKLLIARAQAGVQVQVILPDRSNLAPNANLATAKFLLSRGGKNLRVYRYPGMIHGKVMLCDDTAFIGSANLTRASLHLLQETNGIFSPATGIPQQLLTQLQADLTLSSPLTGSDFPAYSVWRSRLERWWV